MPRCFLNHATTDKRIVHKAKEYLEHCLIDAWIDEERIQPGAQLLGTILASVRASDTFAAFVSKDYLGSAWCMAEFEEVSHMRLSNPLTVIMVLLDEQKAFEEIVDGLPAERRALLRSAMSKYLYISFDRYQSAEGCKRLATALWQKEQIDFDPITSIEAGGEEMQRIHFQTTSKSVDPSCLARLGINIEERFLSRSDSENKPLRVGKPVLLSGQGPNWLYTYLAVQFKNLCPVYVVNNVTGDYVCVYDGAGQRVGRTIKAG